MGRPGAAVSLQVRRQREEDGQRYGRYGARNVRGRRHRDHRHQSRSPHRRLVDSRAGHRPHGHRREGVRAESISTIARREEPVCRRRQQSRERVVPESDLDDYGARLALVRLSRRPVQERKAVMTDDRKSDTPCDARHPAALTNTDARAAQFDLHDGAEGATLLEHDGGADEATLTRRAMLKLAAGAMVAAPLVGLSDARAAISSAVNVTVVEPQTTA